MKYWSKINISFRILNVPLYNIEFNINENKIIIELKRLDNLNEDDIYYIFSIFITINKLEKNNEYKDAFIKIEYSDVFKNIEYINIFKMVRVPILVDLLEFFKKIKNNIELKEQSIDTKLNINDYNSNIEIVSQEIIINMVYNIKTEKNVINKNVIKELKRIKFYDDFNEKE